MTDPQTIMFSLALICCALATVGYLSSLLVKRVLLAKMSTWILAVGFGLLTLDLLWVFIYSPGWGHFGSRHILCLYAWAVAGLYLGFQLKTKTHLLGAFVAPFILLFMIVAAGQDADKKLLAADWQNALTTLHLILAIIGEALFMLASCAGAMFLIQSRLLKHKKPGTMGRLLPSLSDLDRINHLGLLWGFPVLTMGILAGAVFASLAWEWRWLTDPKVIWSVAVWIVYGVLLHQRLAIGWKGFRMAFLSCVLMLVFVATYLLVRYCFSTMHNFI